VRERIQDTVLADAISYVINCKGQDKEKLFRAKENLESLLFRLLMEACDNTQKRVCQTLSPTLADLLTGDKASAIFVACGPPSSYKTTLVEAVISIFGDAYSYTYDVKQCVGGDKLSPAAGNKIMKEIKKKQEYAASRPHPAVCVVYLKELATSIGDAAAGRAVASNSVLQHLVVPVVLMTPMLVFMDGNFDDEATADAHGNDTDKLRADGDSSNSIKRYTEAILQHTDESQRSRLEGSFDMLLCLSPTVEQRSVRLKKFIQEKLVIVLQEKLETMKVNVSELPHADWFGWNPQTGLRPVENAFELTSEKLCRKAQAIFYNIPKPQRPKSLSVGFDIAKREVTVTMQLADETRTAAEKLRTDPVVPPRQGAKRCREMVATGSSTQLSVSLSAPDAARRLHHAAAAGHVEDVRLIVAIEQRVAEGVAYGLHVAKRARCEVHSLSFSFSLSVSRLSLSLSFLC
jgi:hypothetical protein